MATTKKQTARGKAQDKRKTAKKTLVKSKENVAEWRKNKNRIDIRGVDTKQKLIKNKSTSKKTKQNTLIKKYNKNPDIKLEQGFVQPKGQKTLSKTQKALNLIRWDYATHGKDTGVAMRAYVENRISYTKYQEMLKEGMRIYNGK